MKTLDSLLFRHSDHEEAQLKSKHFIPDFLEITGENAYLSNELFFKNKDIHMSKHNRFAPYPEHTHQFLELNYIYKGQCHQTINGKHYLLEEGDILLMDIGSKHSIASLGEKDIVINLLFQNKKISIDWLNQIQSSNSLLYYFLLNTSKKTQAHHNFLLIHHQEAKDTHAILKKMMLEYFMPQDFSQDILTHYLSILLFELARTLPHLTSDKMATESDPIVQVLELIDKDYADLSLGLAAKKLAFNKNYLSNLIKERTSLTFTELLNQKKLSKAHLLLQSTTMPIEDIMQDTGFSNKTYFYQKYKEIYSETPAKTRKKAQKI